MHITTQMNVSRHWRARNRHRHKKHAIKEAAMKLMCHFQSKSPLFMTTSALRRQPEEHFIARPNDRRHFNLKLTKNKRNIFAADLIRIVLARRTSRQEFSLM